MRCPQRQAALTQNDATGNVTGTYSTSMAPFTGGSVSVDASAQDILSGTFWQFSMSDANPTHAVAAGALDLQGGFTGVVTLLNNTSYALSMSH